MIGQDKHRWDSRSCTGDRSAPSSWSATPSSLSCTRRSSLLNYHHNTCGTSPRLSPPPPPPSIYSVSDSVILFVFYADGRPTVGLHLPLVLALFRVSVLHPTWPVYRRWRPRVQWPSTTASWPPAGRPATSACWYDTTDTNWVRISSLSLSLTHPPIALCLSGSKYRLY